VELLQAGSTAYQLQAYCTAYLTTYLLVFFNPLQLGHFFFLSSFSLTLPT
jgi:hypothetical protein